MWFFLNHPISFRVIEYIFSEVDKHISAGDLITEYNLSALPSLYDLFIKLIKFLVSLSVVSLCSSNESPHFRTNPN